ncbi:MAG: polyprenyl synthetase family protein, partial [Planctomycetota bacterium]
LDALRKAVDAALDRYSDLGEGCPDTLKEAIRYSLLSPGKRLRPLLVLLAAEAVAGDDSIISQALPAAAAVEMIHAYSLVHDDLPAMDDDDLRRGRPTCHKKFGEAMAILAGDALLTLAFETLAKHIRPLETAGVCCAELANAAGARRLVGGQADDIAGPPDPPTLEHLEAIHRRKTGAMIEVSLRLGGIVAGADAKQLDALGAYGREFGLAFQITDDLLDALGDETTVGKRVGKDAEQGKLTFPGFLGIDESRRRARDCIERASTTILAAFPHAEELSYLVRSLEGRTH